MDYFTSDFIVCYLTTEQVQLPNKADSRYEYTISSYQLSHNFNFPILNLAPIHFVHISMKNKLIHTQC